MNVRVHFFGMIAESLNKRTVIIDDYKGKTIQDLKADLFKEYPELKTITFQIALNKELVSEDVLLSIDNEIALLPPFAGG